MPQSVHSQQALDLLPAMLDAVETLVRIESPTDDVDACAAIAQEAIGIFEGWLPEPARIETHGGRPVWRWGAAQPRILLLGHLDTVWPVGSLARLPFSNDGGVLRGPGVFDMKAGIVQGWAAMTLAAVTESSGVGMLLTTDEETGSHASRDVIAAAITRAEAVLVLEPSIDGALKTARKGTSWYTVEFEGRAAHAGLDPERGINALLAAAEFAGACGAWSDPSSGTTVTPTVLHAGTTSNTVPALASITLDVRAWTWDEQSRVDHAVRAWRPTTNASGVFVLGGIDRPAMEESSSGSLFTLAQEAAVTLGLPSLEGRAVGGASDGNLTAAAGIATLDGLGAVGDGAHADHEWASVSGMADRAALLAALINSLVGRATT
jgi:glutamate carboxypeptidase